MDRWLKTKKTLFGFFCRILYILSIDKIEQFGYFEKLWIASGAKFKGKERLTPRPTSPGLPYGAQIIKNHSTTI
jgi:hypothetical protein